MRNSKQKVLNNAQIQGMLIKFSVPLQVCPHSPAKNLAHRPENCFNSLNSLSFYCRVSSCTLRNFELSHIFVGIWRELGQPETFGVPKWKFNPESLKFWSSNRKAHIQNRTSLTCRNKPILGCVSMACDSFLRTGLLQVANRYRLATIWLSKLVIRKLCTSCFNKLYPNIPDDSKAKSAMPTLSALYLCRAACTMSWTV